MKTLVVVLFVLFPILIGGCSLGDGITNPNQGPSYQESLIRGLSARPYAVWSPDGDKILFCRDGDIWTMDGAGSSLDRSILSPDKNKNVSHLNWNVYERILFQMNYPVNSTSEIWSKKSFSGMAEKIDFDFPDGRYQFPAISPDGSHLVFSYNDKMYLSEYPPKRTSTVVKIEKKINKPYEWARMYSWSRDGGKIVFSAKTSEGINIYVMNVETGVITQITKGNFNDCNPSWDRTGLRIAFDSDRFAVAYGQQNICLMMGDGSYLKKLTDVEGEYPRFSPANYDLLYSSKMVEGWKINLLHKAI